jgi:hypothetical protein
MKKVIKGILLIYGIFGVPFLSNSQTVPSYVPTNGLIAWWPFNGNANDVSGNGNNGTVFNALLTTDRYGNNNSSYLFNSSSSSHISLNNSIGNFGTSNFTISWWQSRIFTNAASASCVFGKRNAIGLGNLIQTNSNPGFEIRQGTSNPDYVADNGVSVYNSPDWFHSVVVRKDTQILVYVNGSLTHTFSNPIIQNLNNNALAEIGARYAGSSLVQLFNGKIDDLGIWNRALTSNEIQKLYISECSDSTIFQPINITSNIGNNANFSIAFSGNSINYIWQSNSVGLGWQNVPNIGQYNGVNSNNLIVNNLGVSNHNQLFRVIANRIGCPNDTSKQVNLIISNIANDSILINRLRMDSVICSNRVNNLVNDSNQKITTIGLLNTELNSKNSIITFLQNDTTAKADTIKNLRLALLNKHDTVYVSSVITSDTLKISITTGLSSTSGLINRILVYPNPASTLLHIDLQTPGHFIATITGITGQTVITPTSGTIDISTLANGLYILNIYDHDNKLLSTNKVMILR